MFRPLHCEHHEVLQRWLGRLIAADIGSRFAMIVFSM